MKITLTETELVKAFQLWLDATKMAPLNAKHSPSALMNASTLLHYINQVQK